MRSNSGVSDRNCSSFSKRGRGDVEASESSLKSGELVLKKSPHYLLVRCEAKVEVAMEKLTAGTDIGLVEHAGIKIEA